MRELCRRLKPIIGQQADRIWQGYLAEDENGKAQVMDYLELLAARHFHDQIDYDQVGLVPPSAEVADGEYELGNVLYNNRELYPFGLRESEWIQHVGVFGRSGAGKTNMGFLIVQRLIEDGKNPLILDWKRNYRDLLPLLPEKNIAVYTIGRPIAPISFNPLIPPPQTNPRTWLKKLIAVIAHAYLLGDGVIFLLQEAIDRVYHRAGVYRGSVDRWPTFRDVLAVLKERDAAGREAGWLSSGLRALASLTFGDMDSLLNHGHDDVRQLLEQPAILELDALTQSDKVFFTQALLLWIHHFRMAEGVREQFRHAIVVEEAHHILSGERQSLVGGQSVMDLTFREIREFGESLVILDQHPSQISMPALGNTYTTICFNLKHRSDVNAIAQAMLLQDEEKTLLGSLPLGQAIVRLQGRGERPFVIAVPEFKIRKGSITDADVMHHMARLGLLSIRRQNGWHPPEKGTATESSSRINRTERIHSPEGGVVGGPSLVAGVREADSLVGNAPSQSELPDSLLAFLRDVSKYPDSGIAERYKRLGLSVRQGQKQKQMLIDRGLIREELEFTRTAKRRVVRLTEQGDRVLLESDLRDGNAEGEDETFGDRAGDRQRE